MSDRRIYVACLASYNVGTLHGAWINASEDADEMGEAIEKMIAESPSEGAEEWAIHDREGDWYDLPLGEFASLEDVTMHHRMLNEYGAAWAAYVDTVGAHYATEDGFQDAFLGEFDDKEAWAESYFDAVGEIPRHLAYYVAYDRFARDAELSGDVTFANNPDGGVFVFSNH